MIETEPNVKDHVAFHSRVRPSQTGKRCSGLWRRAEQSPLPVRPASWSSWLPRAMQLTPARVTSAASRTELAGLHGGCEVACIASFMAGWTRNWRIPRHSGEWAIARHNIARFPRRHALENKLENNGDGE